MSKDVEYRTWKVPDLRHGDADNDQATPVYQPGTASHETSQHSAVETQDNRSWDDGYRAGLEEGLKQSGMDQETLKQQLLEILQAMSRPLDRINDAVETELVELSLAVAKMILRREIKEDPRHIVGLIRESVKQLPAATLNIRVILNPGDAKVVREVLAGSEENQRWHIEEDPAMHAGECQIHTDTSFIDAGLDGLINRLAIDMLGGQRSADLNEVPADEYS